MFVEVGTANGYFGRTYKNSSGVNKVIHLVS